MFPPQRIICLTEETAETLYLLGEESRIVGISGYVVRLPRARREKSRVSAFTSADIPKTLDLQPDLVLTFSDLQADIAAALIRANVEVHAFNQRTVTQILDMIRTLGALVGAVDRADRLAGKLAAKVEIAQKRAAQLRSRPRVYFEEWDDPMISGIGWVSELIAAAGGVDVFADRASCKSFPCQR
jgi:iron complex transport system substrate-binding protein